MQTVTVIEHGVIGGISVGLGVEQLLLKLEEHYSRDEFKQQILEAIEEARLELLDSLELNDGDSENNWLN